MVRICRIISTKIGSGLCNLTSGINRFSDDAAQSGIPKGSILQELLKEAQMPELPKMPSELPTDFADISKINMPELDRFDTYDPNTKYDLIEEWGDVLFTLGFAACMGIGALRKQERAKKTLENKQLRLTA